jgi:hypothetical protein
MLSQLILRDSVIKNLIAEEACILEVSIDCFAPEFELREGEWGKRF